MYFGLARLPLYPFVGVGFLIVMAVGVALALVYVVGANSGRKAAAMYTDACVGTLLIGTAIDIVWALASGQWGGFMSDIGIGPLVEMLVLAAMFLLSMWFMAVRYTQGLSDR